MISEQEQTDELLLQVDPVPGSINLYTFLAFIAGTIGGYLFTASVFGLGLCSVLAVFIGLIFGAGVSYVAERVLRAIIVSNRFIRIASDRISFIFGGREVRHIDPREDVNVTAWHFATKRRSRVPKGWHVVALGLEQDEIFLPVYALVSPEDFEEMQTADLYRELTGSRKDYKVDQDVRLAGEQRRILMNETARSIDGVEMRLHDMEHLIAHLRRRFPGWMPRS
ncbi:MAG: hypothetical protein EA396_14930 [Anaerolineaceae bacterium]|nr:MAG: hypothetical protein EA396_14930 [Anaerolineaceae bacterium]